MDKQDAIIYLSWAVELAALAWLCHFLFVGL